MENSNLLIASAGIGILSHVLYFNRGEHHMWAIRYIFALVASIATGAAALIQLYNWPVTSAFTTTLSVTCSWFTGLFTSLLIYRIFLSKLNKFPGPFGAKISTLWMTVHGRKNDLYLKNEALHKKYVKLKGREVPKLGCEILWCRSGRDLSLSRG